MITTIFIFSYFFFSFLVFSIKLLFYAQLACRNSKNVHIQTCQLSRIGCEARSIIQVLTSASHHPIENKFMVIESYMQKLFLVDCPGHHVALGQCSCWTAGGALANMGREQHSHTINNPLTSCVRSLFYSNNTHINSRHS